MTKTTPNVEKSARKKAARHQRMVRAKIEREQHGTSPPKHAQTYADRNRLLNKLGFATYSEYLASPVWASIQRRAYQFHGSECRLCQKPAQCIHHRGYGRAVLLGENLSPLVPLCSNCHFKVEHESNGRKRKLHEAQTAYARLWKAVKSAWKKATKNHPEQRRGLFGYCRGCGYKAKKGSLYCRQCARA